ncbi:hypothetical protein ASPVEDRAFT_85437 [Aspergillus versicolor CBS 583.65]|uniref:Uncharacterized protein n=1 Tax=Aspergillus versicolor CBS 583.65 TaxID=1036611 RepID=A0A1L9PRF9_ASPVE|nr:uncharacterized protein ASPVEDRAFT_85437 [Aspergillus versicolor CBS 583.65]OJJ04022.1 hypothetical protein ASPVEDRAFT_85437 [Aspergillus versicolor CBS 583.65]
MVRRRAWTHNTGGGSFPTLRDEVGKPFWGTPGRYLPKNMLLSLVEALGHEYKDLLDWSGYNTACGDKNLLLEGKDRGGDESDEEDSEDEDSETDGDEAS